MAITLDAALAVGALMTGVWLVSLPLKNVSIIDIAWGPGLALTAWVAYAGPADIGLLIPILVSLWALRLAGHLLYRAWGSGEDPRYVAIREKTPAFPLTSLVVIFAFQGALILAVSLPFQFIPEQAGPRSPGALLWLGLGLWGSGFLCETIADAQLMRFKRDPSMAGEVLDRGLWRYSRHPNYFGDFLLWWGLFALGLDRGAPLWTAAGPLVMSYLLLRFSGVPLLEKRLNETRPRYRDYAAKTPAFFPWFPRA